MDHFGGTSLPHKAQCLAIHKYKARVKRQGMFLDKMSQKDQQLAKKVVKYQTFLSHQMLNKIKENQLKIFEQQMKQYCQKHSSYKRNKSQQTQNYINMGQYIQSIKNKAKEDFSKKRRLPTSPDKSSFIFEFSPKVSFCKKQEKSLSKQIQANQFKNALQRKKNQKVQQKQLKTKGTLLKSSILQLIQKSQYLQHTKLLNKNPLFYPLAQNSSKNLPPTDKLKYEKQRLTTVLEHHASIQFKPLGNVRKNFKTKKLIHNSEKKGTAEIPPIIKKNSKFSLNQNMDIPSNDQMLNIQKNIVIRPAKRTPVNLSQPNIMKSFVDDSLD